MSVRNGTPVKDPEKQGAILQQAIRTFAEVGFRGTDVQVIADRAGVGKGTVYRYFGNKQDLFWAATFEVMSRLERHLFAAMEGVEGAHAKLHAAAVAYAGFFQANPECLEVFVQDRAEFRGAAPESHRQYHEILIAKFGEIFRQGIEAGQFRPADTRQTMMTLGSLLYGTVVLGCHLAHDVPVTEMAAYGVETFLNGLRADAPSTTGRELR